MHSEQILLTQVCISNAINEGMERIHDALLKIIALTIKRIRIAGIYLPRNLFSITLDVIKI